MTTPTFVVLADDRTGAWETAGACADRLGSALVVSTARRPDGEGSELAGDGVIDLGSRHLQPHHAATIIGEVSARMATGAGTRILHKIDSTLRGNWAHEIVRASAINGRPVMMVPSFPAVGRTCRNGVVFDGERPVHDGAAGHDPRRPVMMSRPAGHLQAAGAHAVVELATVDSVGAWLAYAPRGVAVCDAQTDDELEALGSLWAAHQGISFAGTAASVAAAVGALQPRHHETRRRRPPLPGPALVVCGSLHPIARRQLTALRSESLGSRVEIIDSEIPDRATVTATQASLTATLLAEATHRARTTTTFASVVIIGGDTAAAILGDRDRVIEGTIGPGLPWSIDGQAVLVTRPGGFGSERSLIELFSAKMVE